MSEIQKISDSEMKIMQIIWTSRGLVTSAQLQLELNGNQHWKPTTVLTFLARLVEKGLLSVVKKGKSNEYIPLVTESEYKQFETKSFLKEVHNGSIESFVAALCVDNDMNIDDINELKKWFSERSGN